MMGLNNTAWPASNLCITTATSTTKCSWPKMIPTLSFTTTGPRISLSKGVRIRKLNILWRRKTKLVLTGFRISQTECALFDHQYFFSWHFSHFMVLGREFFRVYFRMMRDLAKMIQAIISYLSHRASNAELKSDQMSYLNHTQVINSYFLQPLQPFIKGLLIIRFAIEYHYQATSNPTREISTSFPRNVYHISANSEPNSGAETQMWLIVANVVDKGMVINKIQSRR